MKNGYTLSQTAGAKLESAVNRNELMPIAGQMFEWMATGSNMKLVAEFMLSYSHEEYWRLHAYGEKIKDVLAMHNLDSGTSEAVFVGYRDLKKEMDGWGIAEEMWGLTDVHPKSGFERYAVTMNQIRAIHQLQLSPEGKLKVSTPKETFWNVFPVLCGHAYAVFIRYEEGGKTTIKGGNWTDMRWDSGTRIFSTNQFRGSFG